MAKVFKNPNRFLDTEEGNPSIHPNIHIYICIYVHMYIHIFTRQSTEQLNSKYVDWLNIINISILHKYFDSLLLI